jgi:hypothetical protein
MTPLPGAMPQALMNIAVGEKKDNRFGLLTGSKFLIRQPYDISFVHSNLRVLNAGSIKSRKSINPNSWFG